LSPQEREEARDLIALIDTYLLAEDPNLSHYIYKFTTDPHIRIIREVMSVYSANGWTPQHENNALTLIPNE
jgi:hypothetical protein